MKGDKNSRAVSKSHLSGREGERICQTSGRDREVQETPGWASVGAPCGRAGIEEEHKASQVAGGSFHAGVVSIALDREIELVIC